MVVPQIELIPPQLVLFKVLEEAVMDLSTHDPGIVSRAVPAVLDHGCGRLVNIRLWSEGEPAMAFERCLERLLDLVVLRLGKVGVDGVVGGAGPEREFTGAPCCFVLRMRGRQEVGGRLEFGEVRMDGVEVEVNPSKGGLVHHIGANEQVFRVFNSALDEGANGVVLEEELERKERAVSVFVGV